MSYYILVSQFLDPGTLHLLEARILTTQWRREYNRIRPHSPALRLAQYFGNSAHFWLGLQMEYDLDAAKLQIGPQIEQEVRKLA